jgi:hypothetical protein
MTGLGALLAPILLSAVLVFIMSSLIHMVLGWHKHDYPKLPNEDQVRAALRPLGVPPGDYMVPRPSSSEDMRSPEFAAKVREGPNMVLTVLPNGRWSMARPLTLWFLYAVVASVFAAYVAGRALPPGAPYLAVFRIAGCTAFVGYSLALWQMTIWYRRALGTTIRATIDGLIYGLLTGGVFGWLWPHLG